LTAKIIIFSTDTLLITIEGNTWKRRSGTHLMYRQGFV